MCSLDAGLLWAKDLTGKQAVLTLREGQYQLSAALSFGVGMSASEVIFRAEVGANVVLRPSEFNQRVRRQLSGATPEAALLQISGGKVVIEGLQLSGATDRSAVVVSGGMAIFRNCTIAENHGDEHSAVLVSGGDVVIDSSLLKNNSACGGGGGAVRARNGTLAIQYSTIIDNAADAGGAIHVKEAGSVQVTATRVLRNVASRTGGAFQVSGGSLVLTNGSLVDGNLAGAMPEHDTSFARHCGNDFAGQAGGHSFAIAAGEVVYALPSPAGRWVSSGFLCRPYRVPCQAADTDCDPDATPLLDVQPCDYSNALLNGRFIAILRPGETVEEDYPFSCAPGVYGAEDDTIGQSSPACSGRCPAGHSCSGGTVTPSPCPNGTFCPTGSSTAVACPAGTTSFRSMMSSADECELCPKGFWCSSGRPIPCSVGSYNSVRGADDLSDCKQCVDFASTRGPGQTSLSDCECEIAFYALWNQTDLSCERCPVGARCDEPGVELESLPLDPGYWRSSKNTTDVRRCPGSLDGSACTGNFTGCAPFTGGPYCGQCDAEAMSAQFGDELYYYHQEKQECRLCRDVSPIPAIVLGTVLLVFCVVAGVAAWLRRRAPSSGVGQLMVKEEKWWKVHAKSVKRRVAVKLKVIFSFYQIVTRVQETYRMAYPPSVERSLEAFAWVGLDIDGFGLPLACVGLGTYHQKLIFMMLLPLALVAVAKLVGFVRRDRSREKHLMELSSVSGHRVSMRQKLSVALAESTMKALPMALRVTFLAFPAISSLAFKAFQCDDLDANDGIKAGVMAADFSVRCWDADGALTPEYVRVRTLAVVAIVCYPVAMPCVYALLFWNVRRDVWSGAPTTKLSKSIEFLSGEYTSTFFFWELAVVIQKFLLVGLFSIDLPGAKVGSLNQIVIGFITVLCFLVALMSAKPYRRAEDDVIALTSAFALVMFFFFSLVLKVQTLTEAVGEQLPAQLKSSFHISNEANMALLVGSTLSALLIGGAMIVIELTATAVTQAAEKRRQAALQQELNELRAQLLATQAERETMVKVLGADDVPDPLRRCLIPRDEIQLGSARLGAGSFGEVWPASFNGTPVAVKKLHRNKLNEPSLRAFRAEVEMMLTLRHPNVVQLIGGAWTLQDVDVFMVLELCERGSLEGLLANGPTRWTLSWAKHKLPFAIGVARGMAYLHCQEPPVTHCDLKPANILIDDGFNAKVADFGASREVDLAKTMEAAGTPLYMAPELLRRERYDEKVRSQRKSPARASVCHSQNEFPSSRRRLNLVCRWMSGVSRAVLRACGSMQPCMLRGCVSILPTMSSLTSVA